MSSAKKHKSKKHQDEAAVVEHHEASSEETAATSAKKNIREKMIHQEEKKSAKVSATSTHIEDLQVVDVDVDVDAGAVSQEPHSSASGHPTSTDSSDEPTQLSFEDAKKGDDSVDPTEEEKKQIHIQFLGSDLVRAKFPQPFDVAEKLATDWVNDGDFSEIPLGNPILSSLAAEGLRKAKDVEGKVTSNPNFQLAKGILEAQLEEVFKKWKK